MADARRGLKASVHRHGDGDRAVVHEVYLHIGPKLTKGYGGVQPARILFQLLP